MKDNIDNIVNVAIARRKDKFNPIARVSENEPTFVITQQWFKKWKTVIYEVESSSTAYEKFNSIMEKLQRCQNIEIDLKHSKVTKKDISNWDEGYGDYKYIVQVFWRNVK
jgi:hypothetical protein